MSNYWADAWYLFEFSEKSTNKCTNIPCLSKTVAYSSSFVPMKEIRNQVPYAPIYNSGLEIFNGTSSPVLLE
ncbi:hypothetical protein T08_7327 [Trichinella sp. T8]|nr:hypothetical protein T08_7327 [Trichinella sp. T8]